MPTGAPDGTSRRSTRGPRRRWPRSRRTGALIGIATGKSRRGLVATLEELGWLDRFVVLRTADDGPGKPAPDMVLSAMTETGVRPEETVMIGDTTFDIAMARAARVRAVGVGWGLP